MVGQYIAVVSDLSGSGLGRYHLGPIGTQMKSDSKLFARAKVLLERAPELYMSAQAVPGTSAKREAWITSAISVIELLSPAVFSPYRTRANTAASNYIGMADNRVDMIAAVMVALLEDIDAGITPAISDEIRGEVFEDFLLQAEYCLASKKTAQAGVIAGVVFEDTIRRACDRHKILQKGIALEQLIIQLNKDGHLTDVKAKNARGSAGLRTKATHAQWDEFDASDVRATITLARDLITELLDS